MRSRGRECLAVLVASPGWGEWHGAPCPKQDGERFRRFLFLPGAVRIGGYHAIAVLCQESGSVRSLQGEAHDGVAGWTALPIRASSRALIPPDFSRAGGVAE
ncbi:hypothetical protein Sm713_56970 [Streptomyces sp. TS71-3]|nr:hypothetical protein Sm713_56970 [Streptomyces sp. TS71-3]